MNCPHKNSMSPNALLLVVEVIRIGVLPILSMIGENLYNFRLE